MTEKLVPFDELGFRIFLINPPIQELPNGTKIPAPNMKKLQDAVFGILIEKHTKLTGNEVRFIRKYLKKTQINFASWLNMANHSVVSQWENKENDLSGMDYNTEVLLRLQAKAFASNSENISLEFIEKLRELSSAKEALEISAA